VVGGTEDSGGTDDASISASEGGNGGLGGVSCGTGGEEDGFGRSQGEDGGAGRSAGGNSDSGGPGTEGGAAGQGGSGSADGAADTGGAADEADDSKGSIRADENDGSGRAEGASGRRAMKRRPHLSQNWPELAMPHLGQNSRGLAAVPGAPAWCLPTARTGSEAGLAAIRLPQTSQMSSVPEL